MVLSFMGLRPFRHSVTTVIRQDKCLLSGGCLKCLPSQVGPGTFLELGGGTGQGSGRIAKGEWVERWRAFQTGDGIGRALWGWQRVSHEDTGRGLWILAAMDC